MWPKTLICYFLSLTMIVNIGCYSTRVTRSLDEETIIQEKIKKGNFVIIYFYNRKGLIQTIQGTIKNITESDIILEGKPEKKILIKQISRIDILNKELKVSDTILVGTISIFIIIILFKYLSGDFLKGKFSNEKTVYILRGNRLY